MVSDVNLHLYIAANFDSCAEALADPVVRARLERKPYVLDL